MQIFHQIHAPERVWSQGAAFDIAHLERYYERLGWKQPWSYSAVRDTRTLYEAAELYAGWQRDKTVPAAHTALADAQAQAQAVLSAMAALQ